MEAVAFEFAEIPRLKFANSFGVGAMAGTILGDNTGYRVARGELVIGSKGEDGQRLVAEVIWCGHADLPGLNAPGSNGIGNDSFLRG